MRKTFEHRIEKEQERMGRSVFLEQFFNANESRLREIREELCAMDLSPSSAETILGLPAGLMEEGGDFNKSER